MTKKYIEDLIIAKALVFLEVREEGHNKGKFVEMFQKAVDGVASGEPWCMAFVQYIAQQVCKDLKVKSPLPKKLGEHCLSVWNQIPIHYKSAYGGKGMIPIWQSGKSSSGHTGFSKEYGAVYFKTIEGNTNKKGSREGDGVYEKTRLVVGGSMTLKGFIDLPQMIFDLIPEENKLAS